jgi:hypothetical protein
MKTRPISYSTRAFKMCLKAHTDLINWPWCLFTTDKTGKFSLERPMRQRGGVEVYVYSLVTSVLNGVGGQLHTLAALIPPPPPGRSHGRLYQKQDKSGRVLQKRKYRSHILVRNTDHPARSESIHCWYAVEYITNREIQFAQKKFVESKHYIIWKSFGYLFS